jgi:hypothetical protein
MQYIYIQYSTVPAYPEPLVLFICEAQNIMEADAKFTSSTGAGPGDKSWIKKQKIITTANLAWVDGDYISFKKNSMKTEMLHES